MQSGLLRTTTYGAFNNILRNNNTPAASSCIKGTCGSTAVMSLCLTVISLANSLKVFIKKEEVSPLDLMIGCAGIFFAFFTLGSAYYLYKKAQREVATESTASSRSPAPLAEQSMPQADNIPHLEEVIVQRNETPVSENNEGLRASF